MSTPDLSTPRDRSLHDEIAERFEREGARSFHESKGGNPYSAGTMAHDCWAYGFMNALKARNPSHEG